MNIAPRPITENLTRPSCRFREHRPRGIGPFPAIDVTPTEGIGVNPAERGDWWEGTTHFFNRSWPVVADYGRFGPRLFAGFGYTAGYVEWMVQQRWLGKTGQGDKWIFCLMAANGAA